MKLIIHADDFGMTQSINEAIINLIKTGNLTSTSVMPNMNSTDRAVELLNYNQISIGLHSTFTQGKPLSELSKIPNLINSKGDFLSYDELMRKRSYINSNEVFGELELQFIKVNELVNGKLSFIDSHHGVHNKIPAITKAYIELGKKYNISAIRTRQLYLIHKNKLLKVNSMTFSKFGLKRVLSNYYFLRVARKLSNHYQIADGQISNSIAAESNIIESLMSADIKRMEGKRLYLVVHPSIDEKGLNESNIKGQRVSEYNSLLSSEFSCWKDKVQLINFKLL